MEQTGLFSAFAARPGHPDWAVLTARRDPLYQRENDCRNPFERDYTRILHCLAYRRLKHKTQVFYNIANDHICTRMEHVAHVESVSTTIAKVLGLSVELTRAIAIGHDLGHAPFGHQGERELDRLFREHLQEPFFHEKNGVHFVDDLELLEDDYRIYRNLALTYAVRDGILSHCGEMDENGLRPRTEAIDLAGFTECGQYQPFTWEGCVVKLADKIAYVGRDIEDAIRLKFLTQENIEELADMARDNDRMANNTTVIMNNMISDVCAHSSPEKGIRLSEEMFRQLTEIKEFNYRYIYRNPRLDPFNAYVHLVIGQLFKALRECYDGERTIETVRRKAEIYPELMGEFADWLAKFCDPGMSLFEYRDARTAKCQNRKIYGDLSEERVYVRAVLDYISGMTDSYAIKVFSELITY